MAEYGLGGPPVWGKGVEGGLNAGAYMAVDGCGGADRVAGADSNGAAIVSSLLALLGCDKVLDDRFCRELYWEARWAAVVG